jgi:hypothetical protein
LPKKIDKFIKMFGESELQKCLDAACLGKDEKWTKKHQIGECSIISKEMWKNATPEMKAAVEGKLAELSAEKKKNMGAPHTSKEYYQLVDPQSPFIPPCPSDLILLT